MPASYVVYVSPSGNAFMTELAAVLVSALGDLGRDVELRGEGLPAPTPGQVNLVVAPHEYFTLHRGVAEAEARRAAAHAISVGTEQPGTPWFDTSTKFATQGPLVLDINRVGVRALRRVGVAAEHLQLGYHPTWDRWHGEEAAPRPVDILFFGALTPRREEFLGANGGFLTAFESELRLFGFERPAGASTPDFLVGEAKLDRLAGSKLLLNVHRQELGYFEWMRVLEAVANGCVVVTEPARDTAPLRSPDHFVAAPLDGLVGYAGALLADESWRRQIAADAYRFVVDELHMTTLMERQLPVIEAAAAGRRPTAFGAGEHLAAKALAVVRGVQQVDRAVARYRAGWRARHAHTTSDDVRAEVRFRAKNQMLAHRRVQRSIESLASWMRFGESDHVDVETTSAFAGAEPDVTVVLPLYNYEHYIGEAIDSVVASDGVEPELLVIDDHSTDHSRDRVREKLVEHDWFPMALVSKAANAGLSAARNTGVTMARTELVFFLDADNALYPSGLRRLTSVLEDTDAAFAYGVIERFGNERGLVSCLPWDPARLVVDNYIDAMALLRRKAWEEVGGYDPTMDESFGGWEDYEFWLRLAERGHHGRLVPYVIGRYRVHERSMLKTTLDLETASVRAELRRRHPSLPWPEARSARDER